MEISINPYHSVLLLSSSLPTFIRHQTLALAGRRSDSDRSRQCQSTLRGSERVSPPPAPVRPAPALSLTRSLAFPIPSVHRLSSFLPSFVRLRLSRHPNVLFGNMSTDRPTDRPQSHLAKSAARFVRPSVRPFLFSNVSSA